VLYAVTLLPKIALGVLIMTVGPYGSEGSGLRGQGSGFRVQGSGFKVPVHGALL
jgi:hypothetical protein